MRYLKQHLCERPYRLLPLLVFAYFVLAFLIDPHSAFHTLNLYDTDDYMRLDEVIHWLRSAHPFGMGWFDLSQPRLSPSEHVVVHWARLVDVPIAFFMLPFIHKLGMANAAMIAGMIVPPLLFGVLMMAAPALARPMIGRQRANLAAIMVLFLPAVLFNFQPGRVDHHNWQILIAAFGLLALPRITLCADGWKTAMAAGIVFACGLWIGAEALPWQILFAANLALCAPLRGRAAMRNAGAFGLAFALATLAVLPLALPPSQYAGRQITWFSSGYVIFAALTGAVFVIGWLLGRMTERKALRLGLMLALGFMAAMLFFFLVPSVFGGPYDNFSSIVTPLILKHVGEAQPFIKA
ncbi:MAG TPA: hypothetical protein VMV79_06700, partial [Alphaproteobacteria bacterium]|nr:hypothetical protein [Alphaproteobacteria bacterium]